MTKHIARGPITTLRGKPAKVPEWDDNGNVQYEDADHSHIKTQDADTLSMLEYVVFTLPREVQQPKDAHRVSQLMFALDRAREATGDGAASLELTDKVYEWFHQLLTRELPLTKEAKDAHIEPQSIATTKWGVDAYWIANQLKDSASRKTMAEIAELE